MMMMVMMSIGYKARDKTFSVRSALTRVQSGASRTPTFYSKHRFSAL